MPGNIRNYALPSSEKLVLGTGSVAVGFAASAFRKGASVLSFPRLDENVYARREGGSEAGAGGPASEPESAAG